MSYELLEMDTKGKIMITCEEATFLISKRQQDNLSAPGKMRLNMHLMMCKYCRRFSLQVNLITKAIRRMKKRIDNQGFKMSLTDEQKKRLQQKINETPN